MNFSTKYSINQVFKDKPGWYCGDFHAHTNTSSDGDYPPSVLAELSRVEDLDCVSITDHNTITGMPDSKVDLDYPIIPGIVVTLDSVKFQDQVDAAATAWYRFEVLDRNWDLLAITNPIFVNFDEQVSPSTQIPSLM